MTILVNAYCTHQSPPGLNFSHKLNGWRDLNDPELPEHLNGFQGYILKEGNEEMTKIKYHLLRHIQRVNHHYSFEIEESELDELAHWSLKSNAVLFLPDGTVRSPTGSVLFYPDGQMPDESAKVPFMTESYERRTQTENLLKEMNIPIPSLPPIPCENELSLRSVEEIFNRAMALFVVALRAESLATEEPLELGILKDRVSAGFIELSPAEKEFLYGEINDETQVVQFAWRYESVALLLWVLGILPKLSLPKTICDVADVARIALNWSKWQDKIKQRSVSAVLDCLDLHYRLHWLCRQAEIDGIEPSFEVDRGVVLERHYALNWLINYENAEWDDVDTPT